MVDNDATVPVAQVYVVAGISEVPTLIDKLGEGETRMFLTRALKRAETVAKSLGGEIVGQTPDQIVILAYSRPAADRIVEAVREKFAALWVPRQVVADWFVRTAEATPNPSLHARIIHQSQVFLIDPNVPRFTVGRQAHVDLKLDASRVSRLHAMVELVDGKIFLTDSSTNGTYVKLEGDAEPLAVHKSRCEVDRNAVIAFGNRIDDPAAERVTLQIFNRRR